jgi:hypothetical protein
MIWGRKYSFLIKEIFETKLDFTIADNTIVFRFREDECLS